MSEPLFDRIAFTLKRLALECRPSRFQMETLKSAPKAYVEGDALRVVVVADLGDTFHIECEVEDRPVRPSSYYLKPSIPRGYVDGDLRSLRLKSSSLANPEACLELLRADTLKVLAHLSARYQELYSNYETIFVQFHHLDAPSAEEFQLYRRNVYGEELATFRNRLELGFEHFRYQIESSEFRDILSLVRDLKRDKK
ncbi:MAG: hypothetical protein NVSMB14_15090 [Isosphaeraceae bacterium]